MASYTIAVIAGDGIGKEVMPPALDILKAAAAGGGFSLHFVNYDWSCDTYRQTGKMMPDNGLDRLRDSDSILLGAVGYPGVPDHISLWGLLLPIRRQFNQYVNLRPVRLLPGIISPLRDREIGDIDFWVVRENSEGEYSQVGGRFGSGEDEGVVQQAIFTRRGTDRILRYAFDLARRLNRLHVTSATKSNGLFHSMPFWDERFNAIRNDYPDIKADQYHVDILAARFVMSPERFDIVVGSNLFGDILSDLGPGVTGTIAVAPSANLNPEREYPSMFEPVHGSAPDIAGKKIANPIGQIWSAAMMLDHIGQSDAASRVMKAVEDALTDNDVEKTPDLNGAGTTRSFAEAVISKLNQSISNIFRPELAIPLVSRPYTSVRE